MPPCHSLAAWLRNFHKQHIYTYIYIIVHDSFLFLRFWTVFYCWNLWEWRGNLSAVAPTSLFDWNINDDHKIDYLSWSLSSYFKIIASRVAWNNTISNSLLLLELLEPWNIYNTPRSSKWTRAWCSLISLLYPQYLMTLLIALSGTQTCLGSNGCGQNPYVYNFLKNKRQSLCQKKPPSGNRHPFTQFIGSGYWSKKSLFRIYKSKNLLFIHIFD